MNNEASITTLPILTTTVGSYPVPDWLAAHPTEQALLDATRVVFDIQRQAGIDVPTDGELYRFDVSHPDTNGMIEYFVRRLGGIRSDTGRADSEAFRSKAEMRFRSRPAGVVVAPVTEGSLNLPDDCRRAAAVAGRPFKFTLTSPYMLARTLLDEHYGDRRSLTLAIADALGAQAAGLQCACVQVDEANIPGNPADAPIAAKGINRVLDAVRVEKAVHFCFGNYGGQTIQKGEWAKLIDYLNALHVDHIVMETAHRPPDELSAFRDLRPEIGFGLGVIDVKSTVIETAEVIARNIERAENLIGLGRIRYVHPDCGFWMLKRGIADGKMRALVAGRNLHEGR